MTMYRRCLGSEACCRSTCLTPQFDFKEERDRNFLSFYCVAVMKFFFCTRGTGE